MSNEFEKIKSSELESDLRHEPFTHQKARDGEVYKQRIAQLRWYGVGLIAAIVGVGIVKFVHHQRLVADALAESSQSAKVDTIDLQPANANRHVVLPARIEALHAARLQARVNGYVEQVLVDIGDRVKKGQVLAILSTPELDAELNAAKAQLQQAETKRGLAQRLEDRVKQTLPGAVADQERDQRQSELSAAAAEVGLARAKVEQYQAFAQFKKVVTPFDGVVKARLVDVGTLVTACSASATDLLDVVQDDPLRIFADVPEFIAVSQGMDAQIESLDGSQSVSAKSIRAAGALDDATRTRTVEWDVANPEHKWLPGMQGKVTIVDKQSHGYTVPNTAVLFRPQGPFVAQLSTQNTVHWVPVKVLEDNGKTMIVEGDLGEHGKLIKSASVGLLEGATVSVKVGSTS